MELNNVICTKYGYGYVYGIHCRMTNLTRTLKVESYQYDIKSNPVQMRFTFLIWDSSEINE